MKIYTAVYDHCLHKKTIRCYISFWPLVRKCCQVSVIETLSRKTIHRSIEKRVYSDVKFHLFIGVKHHQMALTTIRFNAHDFCIETFEMQEVSTHDSCLAKEVISGSNDLGFWRLEAELLAVLPQDERSDHHANE